MSSVEKNCFFQWKILVRVWSFDLKQENFDSSRPISFFVVVKMHSMRNYAVRSLAYFLKQKLRVKNGLLKGVKRRLKQGDLSRGLI
jgi:hypothetical protein